IGSSAKCIVTGDITQIDLPKSQRSGLFRALDILSDIKGIGTVHLTEQDVVRHPLVKKIINAYEASDPGEGLASRQPFPPIQPLN
ncbi:MAG: PhoH family protein, partial [Chitinophagales bacterium]|nr:PhoH family protein [Chitinophagales bacterium]